MHGYLTTRGYAVQTDVDTTPWTHPTSGVPQGGAEGPFLFLLVILTLAFYIQRTYPNVAPYPLWTTLLWFADDMAVVTATARQPLPDAPYDTRANHLCQDVTSYLENNRPLGHNVESATMVHNPPPPPHRPGDPPMSPVGTATYLEIQQAASSEEITPPPTLERQLARTLVIARITALSTQALAYFLQAMLIAAISFQPLLLTLPKQKQRGAVTTVQRA